MLFVLIVLAERSSAQSSIVINELQGANRNTVIKADGSTPDWIELYNTGDSLIDLAGMRFSVVGRMHVLKAPLSIAPKEHLLLWFDGHPERGPEHVGFTLPRKGGTLLLIAADGVNMLDVFTYPAMAGDLSIGRLQDGSKAWTYFECPTPGKPNNGELELHGRTLTPWIDSSCTAHSDTREVELFAEHADRIRYTTDGTEPTLINGSDYTGPITIDRDLVIRARAYSSTALPSKEFCSTYNMEGLADVGITIAMDQEGLSDDSTGINVEGALANFSRRGRDWERLAMVKFNGTTDVPIPIGISIHGSGSRSLPKRSFKLHARDRYDSPVRGLRLSGKEHFQEGILRADAGAHTFLRNRFMECLVLSNDLHVDVQPSIPVPLYLNGRYWGLYRWMPPKDKQWLERISGSEAVDVLEGPAAVVRSGSDSRFKPAMAQLFGGAPLDSIAAHIDLANLIDLACLDLYTGRADHDLNVRCYRPRLTGGRWRWVLFDMDLWAPTGENSVERMASASGSETPYIPQLLEQPELRNALLARMTALLATALSPAEAQQLADSVYDASCEELVADHERWQPEMDRPDPEACHGALKTFIQQRPTNLISFLSKRTGLRTRIVTLEVPSLERGVMLLEGFRLPPGTLRITCFEGVPLNLEVVPVDGQSLLSWRGADGAGTKVTIDPEHTRTLRPNLVPAVP